jgi:predicted molibdopterin-dependent oxidoreductase YjgC
MTAAGEKMIPLTIDGRKVVVPAGTSVLDAARQAGIDIPTLCHHPLLRPDGACRLCLVEIEGAKGPTASCTLPAAEGMVVRTDTPDLCALRREILSYTLSEHPYTCLVCDRRNTCHEWQTTIRKAGVTTGCENCPKNGQCEIQSLVEKVGLTVMPYPIAYRGLPVEKDDPFFDRDYNLCVLCGRCVRMCQEVRCADILGFLERGAQTRVGAVPGRSHLEMDCEFCGSCVDVCPTGALYDKRTKWEGPPETSGELICPYCSVGCRMELRIGNGRIVGVRAADGPANAGQACVRGRYGLTELVHAKGRIAAPMARRDGRLVETSWENALSAAAERLAGVKGGEFAVLGSPHLTSEAAFVLGRFARGVMKTRNIDCTAPAPTLPPRYGKSEDVSPAILGDIRRAGCILVIGSNPRLSHPVVAVAVRQAVRNGAKLVVFDPRRTDLARKADLWVQMPPGGDAELLAAMTARGKKRSGDISAAKILMENGPVMAIVGSGITGQPRSAEVFKSLRTLTSMAVLVLAGPANSIGVSEAGLVAAAGETDYREIAAGIASGRIRALYTAGGIPPLPGLDRLELLIVQDLTLAPHLRAHAHIVFPAASFAEAGGTMTNCEGRQQTWDAVLPAFGSSQPDWKIPADLSARMGSRAAAYADLNAVRAAMHASASHPPRRKPARKAVTARKSTGSFLLIAERNGFGYRSFSLTRRVAGMAEVKTDEDCVLMHPRDAADRDLHAEDPVRLESRHGADEKRLRLCADILPGTVAVSINPVDGSPLFPGGLPGQKTLPVRLTKAGAGAKPADRST